MNNESLYIILTQYKKEHITEEEAVKLITDLYDNRVIHKPYYTNPNITWTTDIPDTHIYCTKCH